MRLVEEITIEHAGARRSIQLFIGDLTALPPEEAVDLLVVSAFPGSYKPTPNSLIGALDRVGVSVNELANDKAVDLRSMSSCWLSREIETPGLGFRRILCFEPRERGRTPELVGDIFRSLIPFTAGQASASRIAMPIVASGDQGESRTEMLDCVVRAALHWFSIGMPVECIKIVDRDARNERALASVFDGIRAEHVSAASAAGRDAWRYDAFMSYSGADQEAAERLVDALRQHRRSLRIYVDRMELQTGAAWQQQIFEALDDCRRVITLLTPAYLASKVCKDEYNIALFRHRESEEGVLLPVYLRSAQLPTYMRLVQFEDAREGDEARIATIAHTLADRI